MLRCGQMILAEALVRRHLGRGMCVYHSVPRFSSSYVDTEVMHMCVFFFIFRVAMGERSATKRRVYEHPECLYRQEGQLLLYSPDR